MPVTDNAEDEDRSPTTSEKKPRGTRFSIPASSCFSLKPPFSFSIHDGTEPPITTPILSPIIPSSTSSARPAHPDCRILFFPTLPPQCSSLYLALRYVDWRYPGSGQKVEEEGGGPNRACRPIGGGHWQCEGHAGFLGPPRTKRCIILTACCFHCVDRPPGSRRCGALQPDDDDADGRADADVYCADGAATG